MRAPFDLEAHPPRLSGTKKKKLGQNAPYVMAIQILHYEFLGPVSMSEWGPPMEKVVYTVLAREQDKFNLVYAGVCEHTDDNSFFVSHDSFKCWLERAGFESSLYLAILPMFKSDTAERMFVLDRIIHSTRPPCNTL